MPDRGWHSHALRFCRGVGSRAHSGHRSLALLIAIKPQPWLRSVPSRRVQSPVEAQPSAPCNELAELAKGHRNGPMGHCFSSNFATHTFTPDGSVWRGPVRSTRFLPDENALRCASPAHGELQADRCSQCAARSGPPPSLPHGRAEGGALPDREVSGAAIGLTAATNASGSGGEQARPLATAAAAGGTHRRQPAPSSFSGPGRPTLHP